MNTRKIRVFFSILLTLVLVISLLPAKISYASTVETYGISLSDTATGGGLTPGTTATLAAATAGYTTSPVDTVTVGNIGTESTGMLELILSGNNAADFGLSKTDIADIETDGSDSFTVAPNTGLGAGTYTATVTVSGSSITAQSFDISFQVKNASNSVHLMHGSSTTDYNTIQEAINASVDGDTITVDAGVYREQLTITKNITLQGAGIGQTIIEAPDMVNLQQSGGDWKTLKNQAMYAVIGIKTAGSGLVEIKNLTVDGRDQGGIPGGLSITRDDYTFQGIGVCNSDVTIDTVAIKRAREASTDVDLPSDYLDQPSGYNSNEAIFAESAAGVDPHRLTVRNSYISQFQKTAILVWGPTLEVDINNNTIQGYGKTLHSSGNGIQVASSDRSGRGGTNGDRRGTKGRITNNQILGIGQVVPEPDNPGSYLNVGQGGPVAILLYQAGKGVLISGNTISGTGYIPWLNQDTNYNGEGYSNDAISISFGDHVTVSDNTISGYYAAIVEGNSVADSIFTVMGNTVSENAIDIWASEGDDIITLGAGAETIGYATSYSGDLTTNCGIDTLQNFGNGDRIYVIGFLPGSVNGMIGSESITATNTQNETTVIGYSDAQPVIDFTGGTVTVGDGSNVAAHSIQISVEDGRTFLYVDTDGTLDAAELTICLEGIYTTEQFSLSGGYINYVTPFVGVTEMSGAPTTATAGTDLTLTATVTPADATNQTIVWSVKSAGTTGATITGNTLSTTGAGTVTVTATITDGTASGTAYTKDFTITVNEAPPVIIPVGHISGVPTTATAGSNLTLGGSINPVNATNQSIVWTVKSAGTTGAMIAGNTLSTTGAGTVTVTATITDGVASGTAYTEDFTITVNEVPPVIIAVGQINGVPTTATAGSNLTLSGTISPANATNQSIVWTVKSAGATGATITGNTLSTTGAGTLIITATITNGVSTGTSYTQDFTITVSSPSSGTPSGGSSTAGSSNTEKITVEVKAGNSDSTASNITIQRTTGANGQKSDTVTYDKEKAAETVNKLKAAGKDTARIVIPDERDQVSDTKVVIPVDTIRTLLDGAANLQIDTEEAKIQLMKDSLSAIRDKAENDLYFRLVPVKNEEQKEAAKSNALLQATLVSGNVDSRVSVIGNPVTIETNMHSAAADITLPLTGITLPSGTKERAAFLQQLAVYIEHSDGDKELVQGELVEYKQGVYGIRFHITKFSTFTVVKTDAFLKSSNNSIQKVVIPSNTFIKGTNITARVAKETASLTVKLKVVEKAAWKLYYDKNCTKEVVNNKLNLRTGENLSYIKVTAQAGDSKIYKLTIIREKSSAAQILKVITPAKTTWNQKAVSATVEYKISAFTVKLNVSEGASWKLYSDKTCTKEIADKKLELKVGANTAYIKVTAEDGKSSKVYNVTITRKAQEYHKHLMLGLIGSKNYAERVAKIFAEDYDCKNVDITKEGNYYRVTMDFIDKAAAIAACEDMIGREYIVHYYFTGK